MNTSIAFSMAFLQRHKVSCDVIFVGVKNVYDITHKKQIETLEVGGMVICERQRTGLDN